MIRPALESTMDTLPGLRAEIERLDRELVSLIAERVAVARRVGAAKRAAGLPTLDPAHEATVVRRAGALAREASLDGEPVRAIFWHLIGLSRRAQAEAPDDPRAADPSDEPYADPTR